MESCVIYCSGGSKASACHLVELVEGKSKDVTLVKKFIVTKDGYIFRRDATTEQKSMNMVVGTVRDAMSTERYASNTVAALKVLEQCLEGLDFMGSEVLVVTDVQNLELLLSTVIGEVSASSLSAAMVIGDKLSVEGKGSLERVISSLTGCRLRVRLSEGVAPLAPSLAHAEPTDGDTDADVSEDSDDPTTPPQTAAEKAEIQAKILGAKLGENIIEGLKNIITASQEKCITHTVDGGGYWKFNYEVPDYLWLNYLCVPQETENTPLICANTKGGAMALGVRNALMSVGVIEPTVTPEVIREVFSIIKAKSMPIDVPFVISIPDLFSPITRLFMNNYGGKALITHGDTATLHNPLLEGVVLDVGLGGMTFRFLRACEDVYNTSTDVGKGVHSFEGKDVTNLVYDSNGLILKTLTQNVKRMKVELGVNRGGRSVALIPGISSPSRNTYKRLESKSTTVTLFTKEWSKNACSWYVSITTPDATIFMTTPWSNTIFYD
jgi:hypothetical protein